MVANGYVLSPGKKFCLLAIYVYFEKYVNGSINEIINMNQEYGV